MDDSVVISRVFLPNIPVELMTVGVLGLCKIGSFEDFST